MQGDFHERLLMFSQAAVKVATRCNNEQATKLYLIYPFIRLLGYDVQDPNDVVPEHEADFADKYRNRVDLALLSRGLPGIAMECKPVGAKLGDSQGQLRRYFNAMLPVKVGALTNGLAYEFYVDSVEPNIMDSEPYFSINLSEVAKGEVTKKAIRHLKLLAKNCFDGEAIQEAARRQLLHDGLASDFMQELRAPSDDLCRYFLKKFDLSYLSKRQIDELYRGLVKGAFEDALASLIFKQVKSEWSSSARDQSVAPPDEEDESQIETTHRELAVYSYCKRRLSYLVDSDFLFDEIEKIQYKDYMSKFVVYFDKPRTGRLFDFIEGDDGYDTFIFPDEDAEIRTNNFFDLDVPLLKSFKARVAELGESPVEALSA